MGFTRRMAALRCSVGLPENACGRAGCGRAYAAVATLAHLAGGLLWRLRRALQRKAQADPDHFLRDLVFHDLRAMTRPLPVTRETKPGPAPGAVLGAQSE